MYVTHGPRNGLNIGRKVGPCPRTQTRWGLGGVRGKGERVTIAQRRRGCSWSRVRVNGVIIHQRPGGRTGIIIL